jgi:predicted glycosyltransferase
LSFRLPRTINPIPQYPKTHFSNIPAFQHSNWGEAPNLFQLDFMKIAIYCQHVLGIGHLFRTIEICKALAGHDVVLITGGPRVEKSLPMHVREFRLPVLQMDTEFKGLFSTDSHASLEELKEKRQKQLLAFFEKEAPDVFLIELYPFGRKAFRFELDPVLQAIHAKRLPSCVTVCSVRDILVEKEDQEKHESRVVKTLNGYFDAVLVHSDSKIVKLEETFFHFDDIEIPVIYTGYIAQKPDPDARESTRNHLGISPDDILIVASAGGGSVGAPLLESVLGAFSQLDLKQSKNLRVYTGPFIGKSNLKRLKGLSDAGIIIEEFASDFLSYLAAADLSVSMGGYNTSMNVLAAKVPALIWPFSENQEQRLRAERLAKTAAVSVLDDQDLAPDRLTGIMKQMISQVFEDTVQIDLGGAENTARWIEGWVAARKNP